MLLIGIVGAGLMWRWATDPAAALGALLLGGALLLAGSFAAWRGVRDLGSSLSPLPRPSDHAELIEHGIYASIRHPIYAGLLVAALGWSVATVSAPALALTGALGIVLDLKSRREEQWLRERFTRYADYAARTRRFLPRVY